MASGLIDKARAALGGGRVGEVDGRRRMLGDQARDRGDWRSAVEHYRAYLTSNPREFAIWVQLGHASKEARELPAAEQAYLRAEAIDRDDADLQLNIGHLMKAMGRAPEAVERYTRSHALDGNAAARIELVNLGVTPKIEGLVAPIAEPAAARAKVDAPRDQKFVGTIDSIDGVELRGWAIEPDPANGPAEIEMVLPNGRLIGYGRATRVRSDVVAAGFGDVVSGFSIFVDANDLVGETVTADVRLKSTGHALENSPVTFTVPNPRADDPQTLVTSARYVVAKPLDAIDGEQAIFVAYAPTGMLQPFVRRYLTLLRAEGIAVSLVVNADRPVLLDQDLLDLVACAVVRENRGYDFGAWAHMLQIEPRLYSAPTLYIINDSVFGPRDAGSFGALIAACRASSADLVGPTQTLERGWHIQSYFMRLSGRLIASYGFQFFVDDIRIVKDKDDIIDRYEVPLARRVRDAGFEADAVYRVDEARNPTLFAWKRLIDQDFPFVKLLLLRGGFPHIDTKGIRKTLQRKGFDLDLLDATLGYGTAEARPSGDFPLLAKPMRAGEAHVVPPAKPYKVAFYGPWNYDNGLGSASRGIIAAIRQTGVRLNLHPIKLPFHVHKPLGPPHDIVDFDGPADIAIVHLNPDSWHLLTPEQLRDIRSATRRIGYWVWEMAHLPPLWRREFSSVDRIWSPSGYCADVFAAQDEAPVDVVPHAVPVDAGTRIVDRARVLEALGVDPARRVILYVFDGSSYLVRKNPAALVRAFAAAELAGKGWSLVLKTKHLMDRAEEGKAFAALALATEGVVLLDRSLTAGELSDLVTAADIYASPHCSEGFGLTVAEAMAAGKSVVATDYSGTTQFLDATCGFPVKADEWTLEEDFGHYTKGGTWGRIDEDALAAALTIAARRIDAGDLSVGAAARARIAQALSLETVGAAIAASFDAVVGETRAVRRPPARLDAASPGGVSLGELDLGETLTILPLRAGTLRPVADDALARVADDRARWLLIAPEDARLHPLTARILERHAATRPDVAIFHADDVALGAPTLLEQIRLKPEFDQTLFAATDYIGVPLFVRGSALHALGGLASDAGDATLYDLVLRAVEQGASIGRIPDVLLAQDTRVIAPAAKRQALLAKSPLYAGYTVAPGLTPESLRLAARFAGEKPAVTLCIPTRRSALPEGEGTYIERFLSSIATVDWPMDRLTVLIGDDVKGAPNWARRKWPFTLRRIETLREEGEPFNYSAKMNRLWRAAETEIIVLMNDDVIARDADWLNALVGFAIDGSVGGVGARLLFDDGTIQHAGTVGGIMGTSVHAWLGRRPGAPTYQDWAIVQREWSMVTGAVFATRRGVMEAVGGFDEGFSLEFNDVDLCLKIRQAGLRIVYNPFAEMTHSEKASRGDAVPPGAQTALFLSRWQHWLSDDPAFPPNMRRDLIDLAPAATAAGWAA